MSTRLLIVVISLIMSVTGILTTAQDEENTVIQLGRFDQVDVIDVPMELTIERLEEQGITVEVTFYSDTTLALEALASGQINLAQFSFRTAWQAIGNGAPVTSIMETVNDDNIIIARSDITSCDDLNGKTLALQSPNGQSALLVDYYLNTVCDGPDVELIYVSGSNNRVAAYLSDTIDTAVVILSATQVLEEEDADYAILSRFSEDLPWLLGLGLHASNDFLENNPEVAQAFITTYIQAVRDVEEDRAFLIEQAERITEMDTEVIEGAVALYGDSFIYDPNGGFEREAVEEYFDFLIASDGIPTDLTLDDVLDFTLVETAIEELDTDEEMESD